MLVYNTQTHKRRVQATDEGKLIKMCGPTVYDQIHISLQFPALTLFDVIWMHKGAGHLALRILTGTLTTRLFSAIEQGPLKRFLNSFAL